MKSLTQATASILLLLSSFEETGCFTVPCSATKRTSLFLPFPLSTIRHEKQQQQQRRPYLIALNEKKKKKISNQNSSSPPKGFGIKGAKAEITVIKTYDNGTDDDDYDPIDDSDTAVEDFFRRNKEFGPLFRAVLGFTSNAQSSSSSSEDYYSPPLPLAMEILKLPCGGDGIVGEEGEAPDGSFWEEGPWKKLPAIPTGEGDIAVIGEFLDTIQKALVEIPVEEGSEEDENDMHFIEEGRRCLVLSRFQVLGGDSDIVEKDGGKITEDEARLQVQVDDEDLFSTCWSEISYLVQENVKDTGSLIILPEAFSDIRKLREFTEKNILRPLDWLGLSDTFEVASMQRGSPAIRLIHKLSDIPEPQRDVPEDDNEE